VSTSETAPYLPHSPARSAWRPANSLTAAGAVVAIDLADSRLQSARRFGSDTTVNNGREDAVAAVMELTDGLGADVAFEAVGVPPDL
jgi:threonine dehydrogenase-like Zn-dependent dehydrogenase